LLYEPLTTTHRWLNVAVSDFFGVNFFLRVQKIFCFLLCFLYFYFFGILRDTN